jgi:copper(I)-binding protein
MKRRQLFLCVGVPWLLWGGAVLAHGTRAGDLTIDHPYAVPTLAGVRTGALYFRAITNTGNEPDQLLSARTTVADSVDLHHMQMDGNVMRMRAVQAIDLPARTEVRMRHGNAAAAAGGYHLMLSGLKAPLKDGDRFAVVLQFRRAGEREVMVWVQTPKNREVEQRDVHKH